MKKIAVFIPCYHEERIWVSPCDWRPRIMDKVYAMAGKYELAVRDFTAALEINPGKPDLCYLRVESWL